MIINNLYRQFKRSRTIFCLNIIGLTLGLVSFIYIFNYVYIHNNFDNYQPGSENIYKISTKIYKKGILSNHWPTSPIKLAPALKDEYPEILNYTRYGRSWEGHVVSNESRSYRVNSIFFADTNFFKVFSYDIIQGNLKEALTSSNSVIITESIKKIFFPDSDPIGQSLSVHNDKRKTIEVFVTAVIKDIPDNSEFSFDMVCNLERYVEIFGNWVTNWPVHSATTYLFLKEGTNFIELQNKFDHVIEENLGNFARRMDRKYEYYLSPISDIHYINDYNMWTPEDTVSKSSLNIMFLVGLIILIVSFLNYLNFQISIIHNKIKKIGLQKIIGAGRWRMFFEFMVDSFILHLISLLIALILYSFISRYLDTLFHLQITNVEINILKYWLIILAIFIASSVIVGIYPALIISRFNPLDYLNGKSNLIGSKFTFKKSLLSFQFAASIFLIIATIGIFRQIQFMIHSSTGFDQDNIIVVKSPMTNDDESFKQNFSTFKNECMKISGVNNVSYSSCIPGVRSIRMIYSNPAKPETRDSYSFVEVDHNYFDVLKTKFIAGRDFINNESDKNSIIINETAVNAFGFENAKSAIGGYIAGDGLNRQIIGVVEDYHHLSLKDPITPYLYFISSLRTRHFMLDINKKSYNKTIPSIKKLYGEFFPDNPFDYNYLSDEFKIQYKSETRFGKMFLSFGLIAIIISCLGLIGLTMIESKLRIKEIGIRKVNGAQIQEILKMLNMEFIKWIIIAFVIAAAISWFFLHNWQDNFACKTRINWWIFALAGSITLGIAILTVSWQSWQAARRNPVEALRYE